MRGNRVTVLSCDAAIHAAREVTRVEEIELRGGGGTDLRVGIDEAFRRARRPAIIVVLTDGLTPWPAAPLSARIIAGIIGPMPEVAPPSWIETIAIPVDV